MEYTRHYYVTVRNSLTTKAAKLDAIIEDVNSHITERNGIILADGQILKNKISVPDILDYCFHDNDVQDIAPREWGQKQREYFRLENPYQLSEEHGEYGHSWIVIESHEKYIENSERILALLHGGKDGRPFYCSCHYAQVVYTSKRRFVCMMCGMLHCVLEAELTRRFKQSMTAEEWFDYFDSEGPRQEEEIELDIIDFQDIETLSKIWITDQYEEASRELTFFARSTPEEFEKYRGSIITPEILIEAGFSPVYEPPPPAYQISGVKHDVDIVSNAFGSFEEGVIAYQSGKTQVTQLKLATLQLFHAVELLLKIRLEQVSPNALANNPNNPTVLKLLAEKGVSIADDEHKTIDSLRKLRNSLQHNEGRFNYRSILKLLRSTLIFIERFSYEELHIWVADAITSDAWQILLHLEPIQANAVKLSIEAIKQIEETGECEITSCPRCGRDTLISEFMRGSLCIFCRHRPTVEELFPDELSSGEL